MICKQCKTSFKIENNINKKLLSAQNNSFCDNNCLNKYYNYDQFKIFIKSLRKNRSQKEKFIINESKETLWKNWIWVLQELEINKGI